MKHLIGNNETTGICGLKTRPDDITDDPSTINCKRCIAALAPKEEPKPKIKTVIKTVKVKGEKVHGKVNPAPTPIDKPGKVYPMCTCGCGEPTRGGRFRPGHDTRYHAAQKGPKVNPECKCGCGVQTKGGTFLPGHDAKYYSALAAIEKTKAGKVTKKGVAA